MTNDAVAVEFLLLLQLLLTSCSRPSVRPSGRNGRVDTIRCLSVSHGGNARIGKGLSEKSGYSSSSGHYSSSTELKRKKKNTRRTFRSIGQVFNNKCAPPVI